MRKFYLLLFLFVWFFDLSAQEDSIYVEDNVFRVNAVYPSVHYERRIGMNATINFIPQLGMQNGFFVPDRPNKYYYIIRPRLIIEVRRYYNLQKRVEQEKRIAGNTGNFLGLMLISGAPSLVDNYGQDLGLEFTAGGVWGIQYTWTNQLSISGSAGVGMTFGLEGPGRWVPIINLGLGYMITPKVDEEE